MRRWVSRAQAPVKLAVMFMALALPLLAVSSFVALRGAPEADAQVGVPYGGRAPSGAIPAVDPPTATPAPRTAVLSEELVRPEVASPSTDPDLALTGATTSIYLGLATTLLFVGLLLTALSVGVPTVPRLVAATNAGLSFRFAPAASPYAGRNPHGTSRPDRAVLPALQLQAEQSRLSALDDRIARLRAVVVSSY